MSFASRVFDEPELEFGDGGRHVDPRSGLIDHGPLQPKPGDVVRVGVIGSAETVEGFSNFIAQARAGIAPKPSPLINLFPPFPGIGNRNPFRCSFEVEARVAIPAREMERIAGVERQPEAVREAAAAYAEQARAMLESSSRPDVIVAALPVALVERLVNAESDEEDEKDEINFRDLFKAEMLSLAVPSQVVWPTLWDDATRIKRKTRDTARAVQDPATRAWNLLNALFYKAGRVPWRLPRPDGAYLASYLGIGFYRDLSGQRLLTSTAQMFDERGRGLILRGARAQTDKGDMHPYLERDDANDLVQRSLRAYRLHHRHPPARPVVLKTSRFETREVEGILAAADEMLVDHRDLVWVSESPPLTLVREGDYPPLRGTFVQLGRDGLLFTRGSVPYYGTYPGMRVPRPLMLKPHTADSPLADLAAEVLALTKMNWNSTQFDQKLPIPIHAARQVGRVLRHLAPTQVEQTDYRYYS